MKMFKVIHGICGFCGLFVSVPIWYYLMYKILIAANATELMMFLFWIYMPVGLIIKLVQLLAELGMERG
jgi:hypothetical protein